MEMAGSPMETEGWNPFIISLLLAFSFSYLLTIESNMFHPKHFNKDFSFTYVNNLLIYEYMFHFLVPLLQN